MKLKCIGGLNDGEYGFTHDDKPRVGEYVRMAQEKKFEVMDHIPSYEESKKSIMIEYVMYIVELTCYGDNRGDKHNFMYLRYEKLDADKIMVDCLTVKFT